MLDDVLVGARFLWQLPAFLRRPVTVEEARATLRRRRESREADFLTLVKRAVYEHPPSPYRSLLQWAGCEYGDLEGLVRRDGIERTLATLLRHGVYLTVEEFKGRRPVVRGAWTMAMDPVQLRNPRIVAHFPVHSGGSRGAGTIVPIDLAFVRDCAVDWCLAMDARRGVTWRKGQWHVPGGVAMARLLTYASFGRAPERWFSQIDVSSGLLAPRYGWSARVLRLGGWLGGRRLPAPRYVPVEDPLPIATWMHAILGSGATPHLLTFPSSAAAVCAAAAATGLDLRGAQFTVGGEPVTEARLAAVRGVGAEAVPMYGTAETDAIGQGCLAPGEPDGMHLHDDLHAVVQPGPDGVGPRLPSRALLVTSLRPRAPVVLLNVSLGDQAVLTRRDCGCALAALGWMAHLHGVRSFEKLTAGGMTFLDADIIRVLEDVLPARFGGGPTDYQLVEEEDGAGRPVLRLLVHPRVGPLDGATVSEVFLQAIGAGTGAERVMSLAWRQARLLRVERRPLLATLSGKIQHLHVMPAGVRSGRLPAEPGHRGVDRDGGPA